MDFWYLFLIWGNNKSHLIQSNGKMLCLCEYVGQGFPKGNTGINAAWKVYISCILVFGFKRLHL